MFEFFSFLIKQPTPLFLFPRCTFSVQRFWSSSRVTQGFTRLYVRNGHGRTPDVSSLTSAIRTLLTAVFLFFFPSRILKHVETTPRRTFSRPCCVRKTDKNNTGDRVGTTIVGLSWLLFVLASNYYCCYCRLSLTDSPQGNWGWNRRAET